MDQLLTYLSENVATTEGADQDRGEKDYGEPDRGEPEKSAEVRGEPEKSAEVRGVEVEEEFDRSEDDAGVTDNVRRGRTLTGREDTARRVNEAVNAFHNGFYKSQTECAKAFRIARSTLQRGLADPHYKYQGRGYVSTVLSPLEEQRMVTFIQDRAEVGMGFTIKQVTSLNCHFYYKTQQSILNLNAIRFSTSSRTTSNEQ